MKSKMNFAGRLLLGIILLLAAGSKSTDIVGFIRKTETLLLQFGFADARYTEIFAGIVSVLVVTFEFLLGSFLVTGYRVRQAALASSILIAAFAFIAAWNFHSGQKESCGCFGALFQRSPKSELIDNIIFLALSFSVAILPQPPRLRRFRKAMIIPLTALIWTIYFYLVPASWASIRPGINWDFEITDNSLDQTKKFFVWIMDPDCHECQDQVQIVNNIADEYMKQVIALTSSTTGRMIEFIFDYEPHFSINRLPAKEFEKLGLRNGTMIVMNRGKAEKIIPAYVVKSGAGSVKQYITD